MANSLLVEVAVKKLEQYAQDYLKLLKSIDEEALWSTDTGIPNSIGTLARHLTGNLNHYFGKAFLNTGYIRTRDREFTDRNIPKAQVIAELDAAARIVRPALETVDEQTLSQPFTSPDGEVYESLGYYIVHMVMHFAMHYGQADYAQNYTKSSSRS